MRKIARAQFVSTLKNKHIPHEEKKKLESHIIFKGFLPKYKKNHASLPIAVIKVKIILNEVLGNSMAVGSYFIQ